METDVRGSQITGLFRTGQPSPFLASSYNMTTAQLLFTVLQYTLTTTHYRQTPFAIYW